MIIPAGIHTARELWAPLWVLVPLQMSGTGFSFRVPTFPLMCVIIALTFPVGGRAADHMTSPGFRRNHRFHQAPLPQRRGPAMIVWIFHDLAAVCDRHTSSLRLTFQADDRWLRHEGSIVHSTLVGSVLHSLQSTSTSHIFPLLSS